MKNKISKIAAIQNGNIQKCGYMTIEEAKQLTLEKIKKIYQKIGCEEPPMKQINEEITQGDFTSFEKLTDSQKSEIAINWDKNMRMKYLNRHPAMTEERFFKELDGIANGTFIEK